MKAEDIETILKIKETDFMVEDDASPATSDRLTHRELGRLAEKIPGNLMKVLAEYLGFEHAKIANIQFDSPNDAFWFNLEILDGWCNKSTDNNRKVWLSNAIRVSLVISIKVTSTNDYENNDENNFKRLM